MNTTDHEFASPPPITSRERTLTAMRTMTTTFTPMPLARWAATRSSARFVAGCARRAHRLPLVMRRRGHHAPLGAPAGTRRTRIRSARCRSEVTA
jgi:hypothetical protein